MVPFCPQEGTAHSSRKACCHSRSYLVALSLQPVSLGTFWHYSDFLLLMHSETQAHWKVLSSLRVGLPSSDEPVWKSSRTCPQVLSLGDSKSYQVGKTNHPTCIIPKSFIVVLTIEGRYL